MKYLLVFLLSFNVALADSVTPIQKGQAAPYDGVLFDTEAGNNLRAEKLEFLYLKKENALFKKNEEVYTLRLTNKDEEIERLSKKDGKILGLDSGFVGGVVLTLLLGFVVKKAYQ